MKPYWKLLTHSVLASCVICVHIPSAWSKDTWAVARSPKAFPGSCYVGEPPFPKPISDQYTQILSSKLASRKAACQKAKDLNTTEPTETDKCFAYSIDSITSCKKDGVNL